MRTWGTALLGLLLGIGFSLAAPGCGVKPPAAATQDEGETVAVMNACTGSCPVYCSVDGGATVVSKPGAYLVLGTQPLGNHTLNFTVNSPVTCSSGPATCYFFYSASEYNSGIYLENAGATMTASLTDNGCNLLSATFPP